EAEPHDVPRAVDATWAAIEALRTHGAEDAELERAKSLLEARFLRRLETMEGQANLLAEWQALGDWRLAGTYLDRLLAVTADELRRVASHWLAPDRANVLVYRPAAAPALGWNAAELGARLAAVEPIADAAVTPEPGPRPAAPGADVRPPYTRDGEEDGVHFYRLSNGIRIAIKPRRASPLVSLGLFLRGGAIREQAARAGITRLLARLSLKGTERRTAVQLAVETEALGGVIVPTVTADLLSWSLTVPSHHFARGLDLLL